MTFSFDLFRAIVVLLQHLSICSFDDYLKFEKGTASKSTGKQVMRLKMMKRHFVIFSFFFLSSKIQLTCIRKRSKQAPSTNRARSTHSTQLERHSC